MKFEAIYTNGSFICNTIIVSQFASVIWYLLAVREDRTPGGKHRIKKMRFGDGSELQQDLSNAGECVTSEEDELLIQQLVDANPDLIPGPAGNIWSQLGPRDFTS